MKYDIIASGSSGNASIFRDENRFILIDIGVALNKVLPFINESAVNECFEGGLDIKLFITHEHSDHILGLQPFINRFSPDIYTGAKTAELLIRNGADERLFYTIEADTTFYFDTFAVKPFKLMHDAVEPLGFKFYFNSNTISYATDFGVASDYLYKELEGSDILLLESNYEESLLLSSRYPKVLKDRVRSNIGHLSNMEAHKLLCHLSEHGLKRAVLAHVSENCNDYTLLERYADACKIDYGIDTKVIKQRSNFQVI